jgi:hypothetical protein
MGASGPGCGAATSAAADTGSGTDLCTDTGDDGATAAGRCADASGRSQQGVRAIGGLDAAGVSDKSCRRCATAAARADTTSCAKSGDGTAATGRCADASGRSQQGVRPTGRLDAA